jgi:hypothetical protein
MVSTQFSLITSEDLIVSPLAGICTLPYSVGTTQFRDLGRSKGGSQQDSCVGTEVDFYLALVLRPVTCLCKYADSSKNR